MKITTFNPMIATTNPEPVITLFEELGFKRRHKKEGVESEGVEGINDVRMKDKNGFYVDIALMPGVPQDLMLIRVNVDDLKEACELLLAHGFTYAKGFGSAVDTGSSKFQIMVSPTGTIYDIAQHIKK